MNVFFDLKEGEPCQRHDILLTPHQTKCGVGSEKTSRLLRDGEITTNHPLTIRKAVIEDAPFVARCVLEAIGFENITDEILARQTTFSQREDVLYSWRHALMADYEDETIGCIIAYEGRRYPWLRSITFPIIKEMCGADFSDQRDETGTGEYYLDSLYVVPKYRNCGIGTKLMLSGIENARNLRIPRVGLIVSTEKPDAQKLYRRLGFREKERFTAFNEPFIKMTMELEMPPMLEVCAASLASARTAAKAGATRIELCRRLDLGGLTPDREEILACVRELPLQTFVLIRPRGGDFCYSDEEFRTILDDIRFCRNNGAHGVVVGFLTPDGDIDVEKSRLAVETAGTMPVTFHRAFDRCRDWRKGLEEIIACGYSRILTSGQQPTAIQGIETLKQIQKQANGRIAILAGSGVNSANAAGILRQAGVSEVHGSCKISGYESDEGEIAKTLEAIRKAADTGGHGKKFEVTILGCGSAKPTLRHAPSSQIVNHNGTLYMVDCGEGTQLQLIKNHFKEGRIKHIFISHAHGDHCLGLVGFLSSMALNNRRNDLYIHAPKEFEDILRRQIDFFVYDAGFNILFEAIDCDKPTVILDEKDLYVTAFPLKHRIPCYGFLFREKEGERHIKPECIEQYGIPRSEICRIKAGQDFTAADGRGIPNEALTTPPTPARSYAYCTDTVPVAGLADILEGPDLLYHDSTYSNSEADIAELRFHSTAEQAAQVAKQCHAKKLILGHFSSRFMHEDKLLNEAVRIFPNTVLANEGMTIGVRG